MLSLIIRSLRLFAFGACFMFLFVGRGLAYGKIPKLCRSTLKAGPYRRWIAPATLCTLNEPNQSPQSTVNDVLQQATLRYKKIRQHVNPLASSYQHQIALPVDWLARSFEMPIGRPLIVDIGCARGSWALEMCQHNLNLNVLGLEIRESLVEYGLARKAKWGLKNLHYIFTNANVNIRRILEDIKKANVQLEAVTIQFPDPHFKGKHHKRRLVNSEFVVNLAAPLAPGTRVFMQSDVFDLIQDMTAHFAASPYFIADPNFSATDLTANASPFPIQTEREKACLGLSREIYRMQYIRNEKEAESKSSGVGISAGDGKLLI